MVFDIQSLVIRSPFAWQQGSLTYILSWACQLALVGLQYLRVPQSCRVQGLRDGVTLSGRVCVALYVLDRNEGFSLNSAEVPWCSLVLSVQDLRDGVTLRGSSLRVCIRTRSDRRLFLSPCFVVPSRNEGFHLGFSVFEFLHDGVTLFIVE